MPAEKTVTKEEGKFSPKPKILEIVQRIPAGKVASYGLISQVLLQETGYFLRPQVVGWILSGLKQEEFNLCPWQRVVAKNGFISSLKLGDKGALQRELLEQDGCPVVADFVNMEKNCLTLEELLSPRATENLKLNNE